MERRERCYLLIYFIHCELQPIAKKCWDTVPYFDLTGLFMILCSWSSHPTLIKVATNTRPCSKLGWTTLNGWKEEVSVISHRRVTSSGLKEERPVLRRSVLLVLQLVVALIWGMWLWVTRERHARRNGRGSLCSTLEKESLLAGYRIYWFNCCLSPSVGRFSSCGFCDTRERSSIGISAELWPKR